MCVCVLNVVKIYSFEFLKWYERSKTKIRIFYYFIFIHLSLRKKAKDIIIYVHTRQQIPSQQNFSKLFELCFLSPNRHPCHLFPVAYCISAVICTHTLHFRPHVPWIIEIFMNFWNIYQFLPWNFIHESSIFLSLCRYGIV